MYATMTRPFSTAMPSRAMNPTEAGTDRYARQPQRNHAAHQ